MRLLIAGLVHRSLPLRDGLPLHCQCRQGLEASHHSETGTRQVLQQLAFCCSAWCQTLYMTAYMQILLGIQEMLPNPNNADPAQEEAYRVLLRDKAGYER